MLRRSRHADAGVYDTQANEGFTVGSTPVASWLIDLCLCSPGCHGDVRATRSGVFCLRFFEAHASNTELSLALNAHLIPPWLSNKCARWTRTVSFKVSKPPVYSWISARIESRSAWTDAVALSASICSIAASTTGTHSHSI